MNIKTVGYLVVATLVVVVLGMSWVIFSKETVQLESDDEGRVHTGSIKRHSPFKKVA